MTAWEASTASLIVAMFVLVAAFWCAVIAARHARKAAEALRDTKAAIVAWWEAEHVQQIARGQAGMHHDATNMAAALAERQAGERKWRSF